MRMNFHYNTACPKRVWVTHRHTCVCVCILAEDVWPSQLDQINADPKGNWYWLAWKKTD